MKNAGNQFLVDLVEAAESRGYQLIAFDGRIRRDRHPSVRLLSVRAHREVELSTEYGLGLDDLIGSLPRGDEERPLT